MTCASPAQPGLKRLSRCERRKWAKQSSQGSCAIQRRHGSSVGIVSIQRHTELLRGAIETQRVCFAKAEDGCGARIGAQADDAQAGSNAQQDMQRSRQSTSFELDDQHFASARARIRPQRRQVRPRGNERDRRAARQRGPKYVLAKRRDTGEGDSDSAHGNISRTATPEYRQALRETKWTEGTSPGRWAAYSTVGAHD
jgi:hypothetical protein